jgi:fibronectin-binding autotransporter adhesin
MSVKSTRSRSLSSRRSLVLASVGVTIVATAANAEQLRFVGQVDAAASSVSGASQWVPNPTGVSSVNGVKYQIPASFYEGSGSQSSGGPEADLTWTGTAGDGLMGTAGNWNTSTVPVATDNLFFGNGVTGTVNNNIAGAPLFGNFTATRTDAATSTFTGGGSFNSIIVQRGSTVLNGGTYTARGLTNPAIAATATGAPANTGVVFGATVGQTTNVTVNNGTVLNFDGGLYVTDRNGSTGSLTISGAGTSVAANPANFAANQGRFGTAGGVGTINVTSGGALSGRYFQPNRAGGGSSVLNITNGGQVTTQVAQNLNPTTGTSVVNIDGATSAMTFTSVAAPLSNETYNLTNGGKIIGTGTNQVTADQNSTYSLSGGSSITTYAGFLNSDNVAGTSNINLTGAGTTARFDYFLDTGRGLEGAATPQNPNGRVNINVGPGSTFSFGLMNGDGTTADAGPTSSMGMTIDVNGGTFEARNSTGFVNSYFTLGDGDQLDATKQTTTLTVRNGGTVAVIDNNGGTGTGGLGQAFNTIGDGNLSNVTVNVKSGSTYTVGGASSLINSLAVGEGVGSTTVINVDSVDGSGNALPTPSTMTSQNFFMATDNRAAGAAATTSTVTIGKGGVLNVTGSANTLSTGLAEDDTTSATVNIAGGTADLGSAGLFSGGNQDAVANNIGAGDTTINVTAGGTGSIGRAFLLQDAGLFATEGGNSTLSVSGAGSSFTFDGADDTATTGIDSGYLAISTVLVNASNVQVSKDVSGRYGSITLSVASGGLLKTNEASLLGGVHDGTITVTVAGVGSVYDSGRQFSINSDLNESNDALAFPSTGANSTAVINITGGGVLKTTGSVAQATGSMFIGTDSTSSGAGGVGTTSTTVTVAGAGSSLISSASIFLGATVDTAGTVTTGTPVTLTAGAGTTVQSSATGTVLLGASSSMTTAGTVSVGDVATVGNWTINGGSVSSASLQLLGTSVVDVTPTNALAPVLVKTGNLLIGSAAKIDLHKNAMQLTPGGTTPTTLANVKTFIANGATGGITSADLNANTALGYLLVSAPGTFLGSTTAVGDILVRYTLLGDATLDGTVNFDDLLKLAAAYNTSGQEWYNGDFTNDGAVNFDDLLKLAANYNQSLTGSLGGDWALAQAAVPEPTSLLAIGLGGAAMLGRRRRR